MASAKQRAPAFALLLAIALAAASPLEPRFLFAAAGVTGLVVLAAIGYAVRVAIQKRDLALLVAVPLYFIAWQLSWAIGFPQGAFNARRHPRRS